MTVQSWPTELFSHIPLPHYQSSNLHLSLASQEIVNPDGFDVLRRVYVDFEGINFKRKFLTGLEPDAINVLIGKLLAFSPTLLTLLVLLPL